MVFLAILVEDAPGAAFWHAIDGWEGVEVREVRIVRHCGGSGRTI